MTATVGFITFPEILLSPSVSPFMQSGSFGGRIVSSVKALGESLYDSLQDTRIAALALIVINLLALRIVDIAQRISIQAIPRRFRHTREFVALTTGALTYFGSIYLYCYLLSVPLSPQTIVLISLGSLFYKVITSRNEDLDD